MKKLFLFLCLLMALPSIAQNSKTFKVACLNVDGLPPEVTITGITSVKLNPEGPQAAGTTKISELISQKGWDFFGISEAFNYNDELISKISNQYSYGTFRGQIPTKLNGFEALQYVNLDGFSVSEDTVKKSFDTDGLNILFKNSVTIDSEKWVGWKMRNGVTKNGADMLIDKGYRYYKVSLGAGLDIDVYLVHMDAETSERDNIARAVQIKQLVEAIKASDNKRPILIMGDTNCRYTRDNLQELLINNINEDPRFEIHDPWVDYMWNGKYPTLGSQSLMTHTLGYQKGEVVDKIFYINNTDADAKLTAHGYLQDMDFTYPDGSEISDHYPIVIKFTIENIKAGLAPGGKYLIRNRESGEYINYGGPWRSRGLAYDYGVEFEMKDAGNDTFYPYSILGYIDKNFEYFDKGDADKAAFTFSHAGNTKYFNILSSDGRAVKFNDTNNDGYKETILTTLDQDDISMQWELLTWEDIKKEMLHANDEWTNNDLIPYNISSKIINPRFSPNSFYGWETEIGNKADISRPGIWSDDYTCNQIFKATRNSKTGKSNWKIYQTISDIPSGLYEVRCNAALFNLDDVTINLTSGATLKSLTLSRNGDDYDPGDETMVKTINTTDSYKRSLQIEAVNNLTIEINCPHHSSKYYAYLDNFSLVYLGPTAETKASLERVKAAIDDAACKAEEAKYTTYDNSVVEERYENRLINGNGDEEVHLTYLQLANASRKQNAIPADMRYTILNNSFEMGDLSEWNTSAANNARVIEDSSVDGKYIMTADGGALTYDFEVTMPGGMYELKAYLSKGAVLIAGDRQSSPSSAENGSFEEVSIKFIILNGTETIGVKCDEAFSADNFIITRVGDQENATSYEIVKLAMKDATEKVNLMGDPYNKEWNLSKYQELIDNFAIEGDGMKEFNEIYDLLREKVYSQENTDGVSYTYAIINPSFEFGNTLGWDATFAGDTGVKENSNSTYTMSGCDGTYLFNTWQDGRGTILSQTIPNLPAGHYRLRATVAADQGSYVYFEANGQKSEAIKIERAKENGQVVSFDFDVAANTPEVTISIRGGNSDGSYDDFGGNWYKVDKFELTRHGNQKVCFFYDRLQKAIDRTNQIAAKLPEKYRNQWDPSDYRDLYDKHIESGHVADPMNGSNGLAEIEELYSRLRKLIFSQTEIGANMSGAITNQSFELGDFTSWTINMDPVADTKVTKGNLEDTYKTEGLDGDYICNSWINGKSAPLSQVIKGVPSGKYRLSAKVASDAGNRFFLAVDNVPGEMLSTSNEGIFDSISVDFEITEDSKDILIGLYPTPNGEFDPDLNPIVMGPWFKADNFELTFLGREQTITWTMEGTKYDTIILPFGVDNEDMPENLYFFSTDSFDDNNGTENYHVLALRSEENSLKAYTPYIVMRADNTNTTRSVVVVDENTYEFTGIPENNETNLTNGLLTGVLSDTNVEEGHYIVSHGDENSFFSNAGGTVKAYHAYIRNDNTSATPTSPSIYFEAPENIGTGVENIATDDRFVDVFTTTGIKIRKNVTVAKALDGLDPGIYILSDGSRIRKTTSK